MPRLPRIETNEGLCHVINRGNCRSAIFESEGARKAFEKCLFEACERFGWELSAYCVMANHYHLCIGTPMGNLSGGMRWLQGTFAARFNRYRKREGGLGGSQPEPLGQFLVPVPEGFGQDGAGYRVGSFFGGVEACGGDATEGVNERAQRLAERALEYGACRAA